MTTPEPAEASAALLGLVETCRNGERGFHDAAAGIADPTLRRLCESYADQRAGFRRELLEELAGLGAAPGTGVSRVKDPAGGTSAMAGAETCMLAELTRRDTFAESAYRNALALDLPGGVTGTVERQHAQVADAVKHLSLLEHALANGA